MTSEEKLEQQFKESHNTMQEFFKEKNFSDKEKSEFLEYCSDMFELIKELHEALANKPTS